jgi:acylphosphatase
MEAAVHIVVKGVVQGVGFRWFVLQLASRLALQGYVRNRFGGEVEIVAEGDRSLLEALIGEVKTGPRSAHVSGLVVEWQKPSREFSRFEVR